MQICHNMNFVNAESRLYRRRCFCMVALDNTFPLRTLQGHQYFTNFFLSASFSSNFYNSKSTLRALMIHLN